jgi:hypothetical protein
MGVQTIFPFYLPVRNYIQRVSIGDCAGWVLSRAGQSSRRYCTVTVASTVGTVVSC